MMSVLNQHLDRARSQPEHIRRNLAFAAALVLTGLIAVLWLGGSVASGAFALKDTSYADIKPAPAAGAGQNSSGLSGLVGAASAALTGNDTTSAHLQVVDTGRSATPEEKKAPQAEPTVIPF